MNQDINSFAGLLPFPQVKLSPRLSANIHSELKQNRVLLCIHDGLRLELEVFIEKEQYFLKFFDDTYISDSKIVDTIQSAADTALANVEFAENQILQ